MPRCASVWSTSPAVVIATALAAGIWWSDRCGLTGAWTYPAVALLLSLALTVLWRSGRRPFLLRPLLRFLLALALTFLCAGIRSGARVPPPDPTGTSPVLTASEFVVEGLVARTSTSSSGRRRALLEKLTSRTGVPLRGSLLAYLPESLPDPPLDATVRLRARLLPFPRPRNPGEFDYGRFLARRGVHTVARAIDTLVVLTPPRRVARWTDSARRYVADVLQEHVPTDRSRALLRALLLGDRSELAPEVRESFISTGLVHLLAVSGLHVMIVGLLLYRLAGPMLMRLRLGWPLVEPLRTVLTLLVLIAYAMLTGRATSVVRAVAMTAALLLGPVVRRRGTSMNGLGVAASFILWTRPHSLFDPGFQLSVSAVAGILLLVPRMDHLGRRLRGADRPTGSLMKGVLVSTAATLATLPVLLIHFGRASLAGILLNGIAIPLTAAALCASVLCLLSAPLSAAASTFGAAADICIRLLTEIASRGAGLFSWLTIRTAAGSVFLVLFSAGLLCLLCGGSRGRVPRIAAAALASLLVLRIQPLRDTRPLRALFFDVGQGDAALLMAPSGKTLLVDAGPAYDQFDSGARIVLPYLDRQSIDRVDLMVLTHAHADHIGGASAILRGTDVGRLVTTRSSRGSRSMDRIRHIADSLGVSTSLVARGDTLLLDADVRIYVLGPPASVSSFSDENDRSIVLRIEYGGSAVLMMGDAEATSEADLLRTFRRMLTADVVKVGHHGSSTSSGSGFVSAVGAGAPSAGARAVVSVGRINRYGHPSDVVMQRWERAGMWPITTAQNGAVLLEIGRRRIRRIEWRDGRVNY